MGKGEGGGGLIERGSLLTFLLCKGGLLERGGGGGLIEDLRVKDDMVPEPSECRRRFYLPIHYFTITRHVFIKVTEVKAKDI